MVVTVWDKTSSVFAMTPKGGAVPADHSLVGGLGHTPNHKGDG